MPATKEKVKEAAKTARPAAQRLAKDKELRKHVQKAYGSARTVYDELFVEGPPASEATARKIVSRLAGDPELQDELRHVFAELREAGKRAKRAARPAHKKRNALLLAGMVLGVLYNPKTGPETRHWLKEKIFGPEETFEYEP